MERSRRAKSGLKLALAGLALMAAMASTGCGQNALLNPTADQVTASQGADANQAKSTTTDLGGQTSHPSGQLSRP